ncbi:MAG: holo-ACP synthase [Verrucomicrobia bacterium]|nr:holo-ACP synthase [Verrucomicrobiota bacterium]MBS0638114.1 holo-ACP synthase [Verrucomicrobiota bacterium]
MIKGIGTDIIEIERIAKAIERHGEEFINRLFTRNEQLPASARNPAYFAGRFAAKEAVVKALGTGFRGISWLDIEVLNDSLGKPYINLSPAIAKRFDNPELLITISHSKESAVAFCLWQA